MNSHLLVPFILKIKAMINSTMAFTSITATVSPAISIGLSLITEKLMPAPTVIKKRPNNKPLNGSILASSSCLNSLFAKTTPAKNAPRAGERPTSPISAAIPIMSMSAVAVKISRKPDAATNLNKGRLK